MKNFRELNQRFIPGKNIDSSAYALMLQTKLNALQINKPTYLRVFGTVLKSNIFIIAVSERHILFN